MWRSEVNCRSSDASYLLMRQSLPLAWNLASRKPPTSSLLALRFQGMLPWLALVCVNVDSRVKLSCTDLQGNCLTALPRSYLASSPCYNIQMTPASSQCRPDMLMACSLLTSLVIRNLCQGKYYDCSLCSGFQYSVSYRAEMESTLHQ